MNTNSLRNINYSCHTDESLKTIQQNQKKQEILQAFKQGNLGFRSIMPHLEHIYLDTEKKFPRPVYLVAPEVPTQMVSVSTTLEGLTLGIANPSCLSAYKASAATFNLVDDDKKIDQLREKCLPDSNFLIKKMQEQAARAWNVYPLFTSGHLLVNGTFKPAKVKPQSKIKPSHSIPYSELLTTSYDKQQIKCFCISETNTNIASVIEAKQKLENRLGLEKLPIAIFSETTGSLKLFFIDELPIENLEKLKNNIFTLDKFCSYLDFNPKKLHSIINILPIHTKIKLLQNMQFNIDEKYLELTKKAIHIVSSPKNYDVAMFQKLIVQGINVKQKVFYEGGYASYADILFFSERNRSRNMSCIGSRKESNIKDETNALALFKELLLKGCLLDIGKIGCSCWILYKEKILKLCAITSIPLKDIKVELVIENIQQQDNYEYIYSLNQKLQHADQNQKQELLKSTWIYPLYHLDIPKGYYQILTILFDFGADITLIKDLIITKLTTFKNDEMDNKHYLRMYGKKTPSEVFELLVDFFNTYKTRADYISFDVILEKAQHDLEIARQKIGFDPGKIKRISVADNSNKNELQFLSDAFALPPVFTHIENDDDTIATILQHYYRRPGPERVVRSLYLDSTPTIWKQIHSSSHVIRAYNNVSWYIELLEKFNLANFNDDEKTLLQLAIVYHDAAAEDVTKAEEEKKSAYYFKTDMQGKFPTELLEQIGLALESKEDDIHGANIQELDDKTRLYISILRFGDRMDFIRCSDINTSFPCWDNKNITYQVFNPSLLDLPTLELEKFSIDATNATLFQRHLQAAMHGAVDLAAISGGDYNDLRNKGSYATRYKLKIDNTKLKTLFETTNTPKTKINDRINDNVRRKIASLASIYTCTDDEHKDCNLDVNKGVMYGIHTSWLDLKQVKVPDSMTLLEKMQIEHDLALLSDETREAINQEVLRLQQEGIQMQLGSLTQDTLRSPAAQQTLKKRNLEVITEFRPRGYDESGNQVFEEILTVKSMLKIV